MCERVVVVVVVYGTEREGEGERGLGVVCVWCFGVFCCVVLVFCVFLNVSDTLLVDVLVSR